MNLLFPQTIGRVEFIVRYLLLSIISAGASVLLEMNQMIGSGVMSILCSIIGMLLFIFLLIFLFKGIVFPRLHSLQWSKWSSLMLLAPLVNIFFLFLLVFIPGKDKW